MNEEMEIELVVISWKCYILVSSLWILYNVQLNITLYGSVDWCAAVQTMKTLLKIKLVSIDYSSDREPNMEPAISWNNYDPGDISPPSAAYMRQWIGSALVQMMACRLFGTKPLSKPTLRYCKLDP